MAQRENVYLSGPMTGLPEKNFPAFMKAALKLRGKKYRVVNPAELNIGDPRYSWSECLRRDIKEMMKCNAVALLPGWKKSKGALLEVYIAKSLKWKVASVNKFLRSR